MIRRPLAPMALPPVTRHHVFLAGMGMPKLIDERAFRGRHPGPGPTRRAGPDVVRLDAEVKQITHGIRMATHNAETTLARAPDGHYACAGDEAYALTREALTASGDICPGPGQLLIRLDPLTAPRRTRALAALYDQLTAAGQPWMWSPGGIPDGELLPVAGRRPFGVGGKGQT